MYHVSLTVTTFYNVLINNLTDRIFVINLIYISSYTHFFTLPHKYMKLNCPNINSRERLHTIIDIISIATE